MPTNVDLFIVTYGADSTWLKYCLATARKNLQGYRHINVVIPKDEGQYVNQLTCLEYGVRPHLVDALSPGHMHHLSLKMHADRFVEPDCDHICYIDCDCIFSRPAHIQDLFRNGRPIICYDGWEADHTETWRKGTEAMLGMKIGLNFMRRHGMCYRPMFLHVLREYLERLHEEPLEQLALKQWDDQSEWFPPRQGKMWQPFGKPRFSEFCLMGGFAWWRYPEDFCWWRVDDFGWPLGDRNSFAKQYWSHADVTPAIMAELDSYLR